MSIQSGRCIQHINNELNFGKCTTNNTAFICNILKDIQNKRIVHGIELNVYVQGQMRKPEFTVSLPLNKQTI